ncbi:BURP domain-containing protein 3-like [Dioscorea cayenensis subsp. rotundata]|uniref:BURP domain-containing protein 3-like n=1 Tax=Dioscorea cayennensis subsp. rotundata TaxID=55577 RepID=A0AB40C4X6_DIOCR|nr:BURP domain-containing protein 3-like [Dioscorea cayenensis subsp. rotundata]
MVEFSMMSLGTRDVQASSTTIKEKSGDFEVKKTYNVASLGVRALGRDQLVVACHSLPYPYAMFYCHVTGKTKAYTMVLEGNDGTNVEAIAVLNVKSGSVPVRHFMPEDDVLWNVRK